MGGDARRRRRLIIYCRFTHCVAFFGFFREHADKASRVSFSLPKTSERKNFAHYFFAAVGLGKNRANEKRETSSPSRLVALVGVVYSFLRGAALLNEQKKVA